MSLKEILVNRELEKIPNPDTVNLCGHESYDLPKELKLLSLLNTTKLENEYYRTQTDTVDYLFSLIDDIAKEDPYFVAQAIIYSRCVRDGMRSINSLAAAYLSKYISGKPWSKKFYSAWDKKQQTGGVIFRLDDMKEIKDAYAYLSKSKLSNSMKRGFASVLENATAYSLSKYKKTVIDISNLVHPKSSKSEKITIDGKEYSIIDAILKGLKVKANTWETKNVEAGTTVSEMVKSGEITTEVADTMLDELKLSNWESLIMNNELGILALLRNLRNIISLNPSEELCNKICEQLTNVELLKKGKIMPYQVDYAYESILSLKNSTPYLKALEEGIEKTIDNLSTILNGKNLVILDCSGSMYMRMSTRFRSNTSCSEKASLIAAMIEKASNADVIRFGTNAEYTPNEGGKNVFARAKELSNASMGCTNLSTAFNLVKREGKKYDRIFILSDNECNCGYEAEAYKDLIKTVNSPYIYSVDLAGYGSTPLKNNGKVSYYYGYGYSLFDDIQKFEFDPMEHINNVRKIVL